MDSITKNRQTAAVLKGIVERAYGADEVPGAEDFATELGDGYFNVAYRLKLSSGREAVLKIAPPAHVDVMTCERDLMRNEVAAMRLLRERTHAPVPPVDFFDDSHDLVDADWFTMPFVPGRSLHSLAVEGVADDVELDRLRQDLGAINRDINEVVGERFGPVVGEGFPTWQRAFGAMMEDILRDGERAGVDLGVGYDVLRALLRRDSYALDQVGEPRLVVWDLWPGNVLVDDGHIVGVIDHERALFGDPLIEAGFNGMLLPDFGDPRPFMHGYGIARITPGGAVRRRLYDVYLLLLMTVETHYRRYPDDGQYRWARGLLSDLVREAGM